MTNSKRAAFRLKAALFCYSEIRLTWQERIELTIYGFLFAFAFELAFTGGFLLAFELAFEFIDGIGMLPGVTLVALTGTVGLATAFAFVTYPVLSFWPRRFALLPVFETVLQPAVAAIDVSKTADNIFIFPPKGFLQEKNEAG